jgi:hypothetical protein
MTFIWEDCHATAIRHACCADCLDPDRRVGTAVFADGDRIRFNVVKAGFVIGGSGGSGTLVFHGRYYPLAIGGFSYGFTFGASATDFSVPSAISGGHPMLMVMSRPARAPRWVPVGAYRANGLIVAADLNGLVITLR